MQVAHLFGADAVTPQVAVYAMCALAPAGVAGDHLVASWRTLWSTGMGAEGLRELL